MMKMLIRTGYGSKSSLNTIKGHYRSHSSSWLLSKQISSNYMNYTCSYSWNGGIHRGNVNLIRQGLQ